MTTSKVFENVIQCVLAMKSHNLYFLYIRVRMYHLQNFTYVINFLFKYCNFVHITFLLSIVNQKIKNHWCTWNNNRNYQKTDWQTTWWPIPNSSNINRLSTMYFNRILLPIDLFQLILIETYSEVQCIRKNSSKIQGY